MDICVNDRFDIHSNKFVRHHILIYITVHQQTKKVVQNTIT